MASEDQVPYFNTISYFIYTTINRIGVTTKIGQTKNESSSSLWMKLCFRALGG
jgi:hypothetical protein